MTIDYEFPVDSNNIRIGEGAIIDRKDDVFIPNRIGAGLLNSTKA